MLKKCPKDAPLHWRHLLIVNTRAMTTYVPDTTSHGEPALSRSAEGMYETKVGFINS